MSSELISHIELNKGLVESGNPIALYRLFARAAAGDNITVGFLGGSITQGSVATDDTLCYAYRVYDWFVRTFPKSHFTYVNAGIGATDSEFAAARLSEDLLSAHPDFVLMEFAVNEGSNDHYTETYEGALRQILNSRPGIAVVLMCNVFYNEGNSAERIHRRVARHYDIPMLSMRTTIYDAILSGNLVKEDITSDDLHPNDEGHAMVARVITSYLENIKDGKGVSLADTYAGGIASDGCVGLPQPLTPNRFEHSIKYDNRNSSSVVRSMEGFTPDITPRTAVCDCFRYGYSAVKEGSFAEYETTGACIAVLYRRTVNLPAPVARVIVDGDEAAAVILDANFEETWGDKLELTDVFIGNENAPHNVRIEIIRATPEDNGDFYLAGLIVSQL